MNKDVIQIATMNRGGAMKQLTVRGFDDELERRIKALAHSRGISLNRAALLLLRRGAGLTESHPSSQVVGDSLDEFIGAWSEDEERELLESIKIGGPL
jgi:plasmid stability protein